MRWIRAAELAGVGLSLAAVLLAAGLARHSREPVQPGTAPGSSFASAALSQAGGQTGARESLSYSGLGRVADAGVGGEWVSSLPLTREVFVAGHSLGRQTLGWTTGPLFESLHVPLVGRSFSKRDVSSQLGGSGERELVLTRHAARAWFGSVDAAVGSTVELQPIGVGGGTSGNIAFVVVGVATSEFVGPSADRAVSGWVPLGAWPNVIAPPSQAAVIGQLRPEYLGIEARPDIASAAIALNRHFAEQASPLRVTLSRGLGLSAQRRATLDVWSRLLLLNAIAVGTVFAAMYLSSRFVHLLRGEMGDAIRMAIGENRLRRWKRRTASELRSVTMLSLLALAALLAAWAAAPTLPRFPIRESLAAMSSGTSAALLVALLVLALGVAPLVLSWLALGSPSLVRARRNMGAIKAANLALIGLSFAAVVLAVGAAGITFDRMGALLHRDLGFAADGTWYAEVQREKAADHGFPAVLDGRPLASVIAESRAGGVDADIAFASTTPVGAPQVVQASVGGHTGGDSELVWVNFVTPSYFRVLGIEVDRLCAPLGEHSAQQVIVNEAFVRRHGAGDGSLPDTVTAQVPSAGAAQAFTICGVAADAQFLDARSAPLPVIYAPLTRVGNLGAIIGSGDPTVQLARVERALASAIPEYHATQARATLQRVADDLRSDRALAAMSLLISIVVVALAVAMSVLTLTAAAAMLESEVAVRWSMGSSRRRLTTSLFATRKPWPIVVCVLVNVAALLATFALAPELPVLSLLLTMALALMVAALCIAAGMGLVSRRFNDGTMARVLNV